MATRTFNALFIHGVGEQKQDFAEDARQHLRSVLAARDTGLHAVASWWAPFTDVLERQYAAEVQEKGSVMGPAQDLTVGTLSDPDLYRTNEVVRSKCFNLLDLNVARFGGRPFTCFAHSLGCLIFTDWLRQRPAVRGVRLVTMGCNIGLFTMGRVFVSVPQLTVPNCWVNVFTGRDMLGYPLGIKSQPTLKHVHDVRVKLGGLFGWTGLSHIGYWSDRNLWTKTLPKLLAL